MSKHPESVEYAKGLIANGVIEEQIRKLLAISGMSPEEIEEIMTEAKGQPAQQPSGTASQEKQEQQPSVNTTVSAPQTSEDIAAYHQASPMPNDMPSLSNLNAQKPRRHWIPFVVAGIIGTILVVGATAGAAYYMRRPEYVLPKVLANIQNVKNFSYRAKIDLAPPKILPLGIMYEGEGNIDYSNSDDPAFQLIGKINLKLDKEKIAGVPQSYFGAILTQKEIPDSVVISGELRLLHKSLYATLKELQPEQIFGTSSAILNSWVKIGPMLSSSTESLPFPGVDQEKIRKVNDKILSIIKENPPLVLSGPMRSERMDGRTCRKYDLTLRKEGLKELASLLAEEQIAELKRQQAEREAKYKEMYQGYDPQLLSNTSVAENSYALVREKALEIADNIKLENASVWIDTNSYLLCKTEGTIQLPNSDGYENSITKFSIDYFNFNKPSTITAPEKAKTIEEFFSDIAQAPANAKSSFFSEAILESRDATRISDLSNLKSAIALYQTKARNAEFCGSAEWKTIYSTAPITPPIGWRLGPNTGKTNIDGTGWIPINFQNAPIGELINMNKLYIDPVNDPNKGLVYTFACNPTNGNFVLTAGLESQNYGDLTSKFNVTAKDNGIDPNRFEVGSNLELTPILNLTPPRPTSTLLTTTTPSINTSSSDKIKISDLLQIQNGLLLYYAKYNFYPKTKNPKQITLKSLLLETGITNKETSFDPTSGRAYLYGSDGDHYILSAILDDASNVALNSDEDGIKFGVDCNDPVYCVGM